MGVMRYAPTTVGGQRSTIKRLTQDLKISILPHVC